MDDCFSLPNTVELVEELEHILALNDDNLVALILRNNDVQNAIICAADAIKQLLAENAKLKATAIYWHEITTRPLDEEEKEWCAEQGYEPYEMPEFVYNCEMPEDGQEILIATPFGTDKDTCSDDAEYGIGLECHDDFDNVYAWAEIPEWSGVKENTNAEE